MALSKKLLSARNYEKNSAVKIPLEQRPCFHLSPYIGWMNDPNGFSFFNNKYHLFYQYNPYDTKWDSMHWGHTVSDDMLNWKYLPVALAPDEKYDSYGCFSGSSLRLQNGKQLLMYTGVKKDDDVKKELQTQCVAIGDGLDYEKYCNNPVLAGNDLPQGMNPYNFRDPKIWQDSDGSFKCVVASCNKFENGAILLYSSSDAFNWKFNGTVLKNKNCLSKMWECPDFFELEGKSVLIISSQNMFADGFNNFEKHGVFCVIGKCDENYNLIKETKMAVDFGKDFYAAQTTVTPDGRRVMIGWLQNWSSVSENKNEDFKWFGQMSLPRELLLKNGRLIQKPISEIERYRCHKVQHKNLVVSGDISVSGVSGRVADLELVIKPVNEKNIFKSFTVNFAKNADSYSSLVFYPKKSILKYKTVYTVNGKIKTNEQKCILYSKDSALSLRIILDKYSAEIFMNGGEQVISSVLLNDSSADKISFSSDGDAIVDITKYSLVK